MKKILVLSVAFGFLISAVSLCFAQSTPGPDKVKPGDAAISKVKGKPSSAAIILYFNPAEMGDVEVTVYDVSGKVIFSEKRYGSMHAVNSMLIDLPRTTDVHSGVYTVVLNGAGFDNKRLLLPVSRGQNQSPI